MFVRSSVKGTNVLTSNSKVARVMHFSAFHVLMGSQKEPFPGFTNTTTAKTLSMYISTNLNMECVVLTKLQLPVPALRQ